MFIAWLAARLARLYPRYASICNGSCWLCLQMVSTRIKEHLLSPGGAYLNLSRLLLGVLPEALVSKRIEHLLVLNLRRNNLEILPCELFLRQTQLEELNVSEVRTPRYRHNTATQFSGPSGTPHALLSKLQEIRALESPFPAYYFFKILVGWLPTR